MGFYGSYLRLSRRQKVIIGVAGICIGLAGPYMTSFMNDAFQQEMDRNKIMKENVRRLREEKVLRLKKLAAEKSK